MKILHVIISKGFTGSELYVINLINYQSKYHDTMLIKNENNEVSIYKNLLNKNVKVFDLKGFFKRFKINRIINKVKPDVVHTHLGNSSRIIKKKKFKLISTLHMNYDDRHYKNHDGLIISNETQEKKALKSFKGKIKRSLLWPCTNKKNLTNKNLREKFSIPKNSYIFGSVGRFHKQKGFDIILKSFIKNKSKNVYLILIGNGFKEFIHYANKNIILLDHQYNIEDFYNFFDAYISASRWETFGISLVEAMSFNLPIITTVHEGNQEWISRYPVTTFKIDDVDDLDNKIKFFCSKKPKKQKYNLDIFNYENICDEILAFYQNI